jgi:hypothetical protein
VEKARIDSKTYCTLKTGSSLALQIKKAPKLVRAHGATISVVLSVRPIQAFHEQAPDIAQNNPKFGS